MEIKESFAKALNDPLSAIIPWEYQEFLLRDILHMTTEDINDMEVNQIDFALDYCWNILTTRRLDYNLQKLYEKIVPLFTGKPYQEISKAKNARGVKYDFDFTSYNPVAQELKKREIEKKRTIPKKVLEALQNE